MGPEVTVIKCSTCKKEHEDFGEALLCCLKEESIEGCDAYLVSKVDLTLDKPVTTGWIDNVTTTQH